MQPIKIKLTYYQVGLLRDYCCDATWKAINPQAREELIVLAEFFPKTERMLLSASGRNSPKPYQYSIPLSVARILHRRWQTEVIEPQMQHMLTALDYALTQRGMKPDHRKMLFE